MKITGIVSVLFTFAVASLAETSSPVESLKTIHEAVSTYHDSLTKWDGSAKGGLELWQKSNGFVATLKAVNLDEQASKRDILTREEYEQLEQEGFEIAHALTIKIKAAMDTAIARKSDMEAVPIIGKRVPLQRIQDIQREASRLSDALAPTASRSRQGEAQDIRMQIEGELQRGYEFFKN